MTEFNGTPFQYNSSATNVNIDNQLAGILSEFDDDYIMDVVRQSLNDRFRIYSLPAPNVVAAFESTFKQLTDGFSSNTDEIVETRKKVYMNIIDIICNFYGFTFNDSDDTDYYSAAYWLYEFFVSKFTENLKNFYAMYLIQERDPINAALGLEGLRKETDNTLNYSKKLFKDPKIASIHCNIEYVIREMGSFNINLYNILCYVYQTNPTLPGYINSLITDQTGRFFQDHYQSYVINSKDSADILTYIKLTLQQIGGDLEPIQ